MSLNDIQKNKKSLQEVTDENFAHIVAAYAQEIPVPKETFKKSVVICPVGLIGVGKTTTIKWLMKQLPLVYIRTDDIRKYLFAHGYQIVRTKEISFHLLEYFVEQGHSVAIDADCIERDKRIEIERIAQRKETTVLYIHIVAPEETIIDRLLGRVSGAREYVGEEALLNYRQRKSLHEDIDTVPVFYTVNTNTKNEREKTKQLRQLVHNIKLIADNDS